MLGRKRKPSIMDGQAHYTIIVINGLLMTAKMQSIARYSRTPLLGDVSPSMMRRPRYEAPMAFR